MADHAITRDLLGEAIDDAGHPGETGGGVAQKLERRRRVAMAGDHLGEVAKGVYERVRQADAVRRVEAGGQRDDGVGVERDAVVVVDIPEQGAERGVRFDLLSDERVRKTVQRGPGVLGGLEAVHRHGGPEVGPNGVQKR